MWKGLDLGVLSGISVQCRVEPCSDCLTLVGACTTYMEPTEASHPKPAKRATSIDPRVGPEKPRLNLSSDHFSSDSQKNRATCWAPRELSGESNAWESCCVLFQKTFL